jgi:hypothetical protein
MQHWDCLRITLLASLAGCSASLDDGESDGRTTTTMGTGADTSGESTGAEGTTTGDETSDETGDETGEMCDAGCEGAIEIADGIVRCSDGRLNRVSAGTFEPITAPACEGTEADLDCLSDADCSVHTVGKCIHVDFGPTGETACDCAYSCASDSDCFEGQGCFPPGVFVDSKPWPSCRTAECLSNSDCGECGECGLGEVSDDCSTYYAIQCRTPADLCASDAECLPFGACFPDMAGGTETGTWSCQTWGGCLGRPLLVDAVACTAPSRQRTDWAAPPELENLPEDPELAAYWAEVAALEHASVASFARFGAQLLALGAPPELVRASKQAALDEIEHARLAYGLASAYGKRAIGPGQLELRGLSVSASWREVVAGLIEEACVGETLGVAEAMAAAESARVPAVRVVLERIADDELRHAQLAWRSLAWLLREADDADRAWAQALLERAIEAVGEASVSSGTHRPADGILGGSARARLHREASSRVLAPLSRALFDDRRAYAHPTPCA